MGTPDGSGATKVFIINSHFKDNYTSYLVQEGVLEQVLGLPETHEEYSSQSLRYMPVH